MHKHRATQTEKKSHPFIKTHWILGIPLAVYTILIGPYLATFPYLDGHVEFNVAYNFFTGNYFTNWVAYHPPLKPIMSSVIFFFFGPQAYTALGYLLGILGIGSLYVIARELYDKKTAILSSVFLALSGMYISTSLFSLNDFIMTVFLLVAFAFYVKKKLIMYAVFASLAVCAKETAIIFPFSVALVEILSKQYRWQHIIPFAVLGLWVAFLYLSGHSLWNSWNFSESSKHGIHHTVFENIFMLKLFNQYAYDNWLHMFIFNYNWVFWIVLLFALPKTKITSHIRMLLVFFVLYALIVLSIQTYTIPRYILPVLPFLYLITTQYLVRSKYAMILIPVVLIFAISALFSSNDPISNNIWKRTTQLDQSFYYRPLDGNDGITYNMQFLYVTKERDTIIKSGFTEKQRKNLIIDKHTLEIYGY